MILSQAVVPQDDGVSLELTKRAKAGARADMQFEPKNIIFEQLPFAPISDLLLLLF